LLDETPERFSSYYGFAIASFVCSIVGFIVPLLSILGIIFGFIALDEIKDCTRGSGRGMAKAGVIIGFSIVGLHFLCCALYLLTSNAGA
jgi:NO-binding membrane sensor protein with MHYT domain